MGYLRDDLSGFKPYKVDKNNYRIRLDANESFLSPPVELMEKIKDKLSMAAFNRYPDPDSEDVCSLYGEYCGIDSKKIVAGNGSDELIQIITNTFLNKGEKVVTLNPDFSMYSFYTTIAGGVPVELDNFNDFRLNTDDFIKKVKEIKPKLVILSNPNNPTGAIILRKNLIKIVRECNALVVIDEAYMEFYSDSLVNEVNKFNNLIVLRTCSKALGMAAIRLGFLISNETITDEIRRVKPPFNVNCISQLIGCVVLKNKKLLKNNSEKIIIEREYLLERLNNYKNITVYPSKANFVFIKAEQCQKLNDFLISKSIKVRTFSEEKMKDFMRITAGSRTENIDILNAMRSFYDRSETA